MDAPNAPLPDAGIDSATDLVPDSAEPTVDVADLSDAGFHGQPFAACSPADLPAGAAVTGLVYDDHGRRAQSAHDQRIDWAIDAPRAGARVEIRSATAEHVATTCDDGRFAFGPLSTDTYLVTAPAARTNGCTSANCPRRVPAAVAEGQLNVVTIGDSIARVGPPLFPERLAERLAPLFDSVVDTNVAVSGSTAVEWLPGSEYFEERLAPHLETADVVIVTIGGNDLRRFLGHGFELPEGALLDLATEFPAAFDAILADIETILLEIRSRAPHADIVYCVYMNYGNASSWRSWLSDIETLLPLLFDGALSRLRERIGQIDGVVLADMLGALGDVTIDAYLIDTMHLSPLGHQLYADEIFAALGGVVVEGGISEGPTIGLNGGP